MFSEHHSGLRLGLHAIGRRHRRHAWAHGGGGGFWGFGDGGVPGGRKLSAADLQLVVLALLEERPAHGYELIKAIEDRSRGFYAPSPGVIYPALTYLEEIGRATVEPQGNRKLYSLTDAGRLYLDANRGAADAILDALSRIGGRMDDVREAFSGLGDIDPRGSADLHAARHALRDALRRMLGGPPDEARRIADILRRAAAEILSGRKAPR
jgi:DNA-binding PadR family transcriptional regulator